MRSLALPAAMIALVACTSTDDRPRDAQYITDTILGPTCGRAECHSQFTQSGDVVLDTYGNMRETVVNNYPLVSFQSDDYDPLDPSNAALIQWVTQTDPFGLGIGRMPQDAPMPNADVELLEAWITGPVQLRDEGVACSGSSAAGCPNLGDECDDDECIQVSYPDPGHGAACDPSAFGGKACNGMNLVECTSGWSFGDVIQTCANDCVEGACS